jgi:putative transposase
VRRAVIEIPLFGSIPASFAEVGFLNGCSYLLHDRDAKFCAAFTGILEAVGIKAVKLPPRSPNLNAHLERWHRSVKDECLSKMILFGEDSLRLVLSDYLLHFHGERNIKAKRIRFSSAGGGSNR